MTDHAFYAAQSRITDPGRFADRVGEVPPGLTAMRTAARELVFHYRADGDFATNGIEASRIAEVGRARRTRGRGSQVLALILVPSSAPSQIWRMAPAAATSKTCIVRPCSPARTNALVSITRTPAARASS
jgi:hypothetical protein